VTMSGLTQRDFERLLEFRVTLRRFQRWSEDQAKAAGLTHVQHQLLVAIKGHPGGQPPTVGDLAGYLLLRPHSAVELVDRAEDAGLVERIPDPVDGRVVRVRLTAGGEEVLQKLTGAHLDRLHELAAVLDEFVTKHNGEQPLYRNTIQRATRSRRRFCSGWPSWRSVCSFAGMLASPASRNRTDAGAAVGSRPPPRPRA